MACAFCSCSSDTLESPTAVKVPSGRLRPGFRRSPDIETPCVNPVTAGKKMANTVQNPSEPSGDDSPVRTAATSPVRIAPT